MLYFYGVLAHHYHYLIPRKRLFLNIFLFLSCRYLYGMHAFGLEETNFYREAEKQARKVTVYAVIFKTI